MRSSAIRSLARFAAIAVLATAGALPPAQAQDDVYPAPTRALEDAVESVTEEVLLPQSVPGTITFRNCEAPCKLRSLEVNARSAFFVGATAVSLVDFKAHITRTGPQSLTVFHQPGKTAVTRVVVVGQLLQ